MSAVGPESLIGARFRVAERIGTGGAATVYRATDLHTQHAVAVKLLDPDYDRARFEREVEMLAELDHPRIVRYVAHGLASEDRAFLAMEWLDGEDLASRLGRGGLTLRESVQIMRDLAEGLAVAHRRGIVHRDLKPSNVFLREGRSDGATLLDFGVARRMRDGRGPQTRTGALIGTPNYMAPEQASGERAIGPAADVFALGCMLYECLIGAPPFVADHLVGVLAKILFADAEAISSLRPEVPEPVARMVGNLLAKDPDARPCDASAVLAAIDALGELPDLPPPGEITAVTVRDKPRRRARSPLPAIEQQLVCVIVARTDDPLADRLRERHAIERLSDGTYVATILPAARRVATDQAMHAARVALDIRDHAPTARIALTTGQGVVEQRLPIGEAIDRAVRLLPDEPGVAVDDLSSALIERRFDVTGGTRLVGEHADSDAMRMLLGKPTPCVGRERELATLEATLATCIDEGSASAVLITGAAGMGKTRLRHELVRRVRAKHPEVEIITGVGDASHVGATYHILGSALGDLRSRRELAANVPQDDRRRVGELLDELCGRPVAAPCDDVARARVEPRRLAEAMAGAFIELLRAEARVHPVMLVLDDIHWADAASLRLVERALRQLPEHALFVVALSRPQQDDSLWAGHALRVPLKPLGRRACERLVVEILGPDVRPDVVGRIVEQAAGNALYLEELIRAVKEGRRELPGSVLAMLQSRIAGLAAELRPVLRAASVFGERFAPGAVAALLGIDAGEHAKLDEWLGELTRLEIVERHGETFAFRHALVAEAAYELLTETDRAAVHLAAATYLEAHGAQPIELAEHYHRAGALGPAVACYMRAGDEANAVGDIAAARLHYAAASDALRGLPDEPAHRRTRVDILLQQAQIGIIADVPDLNLARVTQARELLATLDEVEDDRRREVRLDFLWARVLSFVGSLREALALCERVVPRARELGDDRLATAASQAIGNVTLMQGYVAKAEPALAKGAVLASWIGSDYDRLRYMGDYALCLMMAGRWREAMALHAEAVAHASASKHSSGLAVAYAMRAFSERVAGDPAVHETIEVALEHADRGQERLLDYLLVGHRAWIEGLAGRHDAAARYRDERRELADAMGGQLCYDDLFVGADAEVALAQGDLDAAIAIAADAVPRLRADELMLGLGLCEQVWGLALAGRRDPDAEAHLEAARHVFEHTGQRLAGARLALEWAHVVRERGEGARADELRSAAVATYTTGGAPELIDALDAAIARRA